MTPEIEAQVVAVLAFRGESTTKIGWASDANRLRYGTLGDEKVRTADVMKFCDRLIESGELDRISTYEDDGRFYFFLSPTQRLRALERISFHERDNLWAQFLSQHGYPSGHYRHGAELLLTLIDGRSSAIEQIVTDYGRRLYKRADLGRWLVGTLGATLSDAHLELLPDVVAIAYFEGLVAAGDQRVLALSALAVKRIAKSMPAIDAARLLLPRGYDNELEGTCPKNRRASIDLLRSFWSGDFEQAIKCGDAAIKSLSKRSKHRQLRDLEGLCHVLAMLACAREDSAHLVRASKFVRAAMDAKMGFPAAYRMLFVLFESGKITNLDQKRFLLFDQFGPRDHNGSQWKTPLATALTLGLVSVWIGVPLNAVHLKLVEAMANEARAAHGGCGLAREFEAVLDTIAGRPVDGRALVSRYRANEPWEVLLAVLEGLNKRDSPTAPAEDLEEHILWQVELLDDHQVDVTPRLVTASGKATGRKVALKKLLAENRRVLPSEDAKVITTVEWIVPDQWYPRKTIPTLGINALVALIDHPRVIQSGGDALRVVAGTPRLQIVEGSESDGGFRVELHPSRLAEHDVAFEQRTDSELVVYQRTAAQRTIAQTLGVAGMQVPKQAEERLSRALGHVGSAIQIDSDADLEVAGKQVEADSRVWVVLRWDGSRLFFRLRCAALGSDGPLALPGEGAAMVVANVGDTVLCAKRDLKAERLALNTLLMACPLLAEREVSGRGSMDSLSQALELLLEIGDAEFEVPVLWPTGRSLPTPKRVSETSMRAKVRRKGNWLNVDVELSVDADDVVRFEELLARREGRFIQLNDESFVALTAELAERIDTLNSLGKVTKDGVTLSPLALPVVRDLTFGVLEATFDAASTERLASLERAVGLNPAVPRGLRTQLRHYQREGFVWLARLAEAGLGACLADDMGLGKTIQTLALLLARKKRGPALVVAPTSVASNWVAEAARFAPTLKVVNLASGERDKAIGNLKPGSVLVCSYGLMSSEIKKLETVAFDSIVFDEAHLLKNAGTKRAQAARKLSGAFRLGLTGTPVENHIGELWALMEQVMPGFLGTNRHFDRAFGKPIADGDRQAIRRLRKLLTPFVLRRTKAQVLDELPPRTETTIVVAPSAKEASFYEAVRRRAKRSLAKGKAPGSVSRIVILAEITKLRQAAIDPRVLDPKGPAGAKIDELIARLIALREEGHQSLVFTQFLRSMDLIQQRLEDVGIPLLRLDGSTPAKERTKRIEAFQSGAAEVFLMSLKAGGVGVNLTAADYVFHVDPWWNPAVEDQATGRAHRIGQERPVTVYRLVSKGTIEEKILALHRDKRELAEDLFANMEKAKRLDLDELRDLIG